MMLFINKQKEGIDNGVGIVYRDGRKLVLKVI